MSPTSRPDLDDTIPQLDHPTLLGRLASTQPPELVHAGGPAAFRRSHIPGSLAFSSATDAAIALGGDEPVVVYGTDRDDVRSLTLARALVNRGLSQVAVYPGGLTDWHHKGGIVEGLDAPR